MFIYLKRKDSSSSDKDPG